MCPTSVSEAFGSNLNISLKRGNCNTYETYQILIFWKPDFCCEIYTWKEKAGIWHFRLCVVFLLFDLLSDQKYSGNTCLHRWKPSHYMVHCIEGFSFSISLSLCVSHSDTHLKYRPVSYATCLWWSFLGGELGIKLNNF